MLVFFLSWKWEVQIQSQVGVVGREVRSVQLFESRVVIVLADGTKVEILPALGVKQDLKQPRGLQAPLSGFQQFTSDM